MEKIIILGAGGHAKVIAEAIIKSGNRVIGFLDDEKLEDTEIYLGIKVLGKINDCINYKNYRFIIGIGNNKVRKEISNKYNLNWCTVIHPSAIVASDVKIGLGTVIMPGVVINPGTIIGNHCIINTSSSIDHDNIIEDFVHISPGCHLAGTVKVKENTWLCIGTIVKNNITITSNSVVGAGAIVIKDIVESGTYVGIPAHKVEK